jgi:thiamine-monophosphate kinase
MTATTVAQLGERALIARLQSRLPCTGGSIVVGIGDDAAVVEPPRGGLDVITTDASVEGVHFERRFCRPGDIGHRALAVNLSDLAAMGAQPRHALLSLGVPDGLTIAEFDEFAEAFGSLAAAHGMVVVGGNLTRSPGPWFIDVTAVGSVKRRRVLTRSGARPGDDLYVTGQLGAARAGLAYLKAAPARALPGVEHGVLGDAVVRYRRPQARVRAGLLVGRTRAASACMDLSDGLADAVTQMAEASGVGAIVELGTLPCHPAVADVWPEDAPRQALLGGDDYELLFAVPRRRRRAFFAALAGAQRLAVSRVGTIRPRGDGVAMRAADGRQDALPRGYEHFA